MPGKTWFVMTKMPDYHPMMSAESWNVKRANDFFKYYGLKKRLTELVLIFDNDTGSYLAIKEEFNAVSAELVGKIIEDPRYSGSHFSDLKVKVERINKISDFLASQDFTKYSNEKLLATFKKAYRLYHELHLFHWTQTVLDFGDNLFSKYLAEYLEHSKVSGIEPGAVFSILTTPTRHGSLFKEKLSLLKILNLIKSTGQTKLFREHEPSEILDILAGKNQRLYKLICAHTRSFCWIGYGAAGPLWDESHFIANIKKMLEDEVDPAESIKKMQNERALLTGQQKFYESRLNIDAKHKKMFAVARQFGFFKEVRKDSMFLFWSSIDLLYKEMARRLNLTLRDIHFLYEYEFAGMLTTGHKISKKELDQRYRYSVYHSIGDYPDDEILIGVKAKAFASRLVMEKHEEVTDRLTGQCASPGKARGKVSLINTVSDMKKMKLGNVLVSVVTGPDLVPAIKRASAIVTDIGGITCHAAIISRELKIPCVIGTKIATKVLHDGDEVEVDATQGVVRVIKRVS